MSMAWTLGLFALALALGLLAAWSRQGRSSAARWWVRPGGIDELHRPYWYNEIIALLLVPYFAQLAVVAGILTLPGIPGAMVATAVIAEIGAGIAVTAPFAYRTVLPIRIYPRWLRAERTHDLEWLRAARRARPKR